MGAASYAQEDDKKEASVLKSEIKALEKSISDTEKEIVKLEKSVVKTRPEAEQASRDQINITEMMETKRREAESFQYDKKKAELKAATKGLKKTTKEQSKLQKSLDKNESVKKDAEAQVELTKTQQMRTQVALESTSGEMGDVTKKDQKAMNATLQSKDTVPAEDMNKALLYKQKSEEKAALSKELSTHNKAVSKAEGANQKVQQQRLQLLDEKKIIDEQQITESKAVESLKDELSKFDPKMVQKRLKNYLKMQTRPVSLLKNCNWN